MTVFGPLLVTKITLPPRQSAPAETVLTVLLNQLHAIEHPLVFVLDDYHLIAHPPIHDGLTFAIEHLPPHVHLVLISRSVPALPLHRWTRRDNQHTVDS